MMKKMVATEKTSVMGRKAERWVFIFLILLAFGVTAGQVYAQLDYISDPVGTTLELFDYYVYGNTTATSGGQSYLRTVTINSSGGINEDSPLRFVQDHWNVTGNLGTYNPDTGVVTGRSGQWWQKFLDNDGPLTPALGQGIVQRFMETNTDAQGRKTYSPRLSNAVTQDPNQQSLAYLFDHQPTTYTTDRSDVDIKTYPKKEVYPDMNMLFHVDDEGFYLFDSDWQDAKVPNKDTCVNVGCDFNVTVVSEHTGDNVEFFPFGEAGSGGGGTEYEHPENYFLGMHMRVENFSIPVGYTVLNKNGDDKNMRFEFSGDDDVWVFIDGVLIGDLGGIHQPEDLTIDFTTGEVIVKCHNRNITDENPEGTYPQATCGDPIESTIKGMFERARAEFQQGQAPITDADGNNIIYWDNALNRAVLNEAMFDGDKLNQRTYHHLDFFYLERGSGDSNMKIRFNMISTTDLSAQKVLQIDAGEAGEGEQRLRADQFRFRLTGYPNGDRNAPMPMSDPNNGDVYWNDNYINDHQTVKTRILEVGNAADGKANFGTIVDEFTYDQDNPYCYTMEELPPVGATKISETEYVYNGQIVSRNPDGRTYTFGNIVYDLKPIYFKAELHHDENWITRTYCYDENCQNEIDRESEDWPTFIGFTNRYGASGSFLLQGTKSVVNNDDTNEDRIFRYSLRYAGDPADAEPVVTGTAVLHDNDTIPAEIDFGGAISLSRETLVYLASEQGGRRARQYTSGEDNLDTWDINYVLTEDLPEDKDIIQNTASYNITVTAVDDGNGNLICSVDYHNVPVAFVNTERRNTSVNVEGHKVLLGREMLATDQWTYTLAPINGGPEPLPTEEDPDPGETHNIDPANPEKTGTYFSFGNIIFTPDHLGPCRMTQGVYTCEEKIYHYDVTEAPRIPGIYNDTFNPKRFNVRVYLNGEGNVAAQVTWDGTPTTLDGFLTFTNTYTATGDIRLNGTKKVDDTDGNYREPRVMTFILEDPAGFVADQNITITVHDSAVSDQTGAEAFSFSDISYSLDQEGKLVINGTPTGIAGTPVQGSTTGERTWTQTYIITEKDPALTDNGLLPNHQRFEVTVTITDNGVGQLSTTRRICEYDTSKPDQAPVCSTGTDIQFAFLNKERKDIQVSIPGSKIVEGHTLGPNDKWYFHIEPDPQLSPAGAPLPQETTVQNAQNGSYSFGPITFTPQDLGNQGAAQTYYYRVSESGNVPNYSNATGHKEFSITLSTITDVNDPNYGELTYTISPSAIEAFTNFYYAEDNTVLAAMKTMNVSSWPSGTPAFEFTLTGTNTQAVQKINAVGGTGGILTARSTEANPLARFSAFTFTRPDYDAMQALIASTGDPNAGTYQFTLKETVPAGAVNNVLNGVTYSSDEYKIWIELGWDAEKGEVTETVYRQRQGSTGARERVNPMAGGVVFNVGDFANEYHVNNVSWTPQASKDVIDVDRINKTRTFTFDLSYAQGDAPLAVQSKVIDDIKDLDDPRTFDFNTIAYTRETTGTLPNNTYRLSDLVAADHAMQQSGANGSIVWTIPYILTEQDPNDKEIRENKQSFLIVVTVTDNGRGELTRTINPTNFASLAFINEEIENVSVPIVGTKYIPQRSLKAEDKWTFVIWSTNNGPLPAPGNEQYNCDQAIADEIRSKYNEDYGGSTHSIGTMRCVQNDFDIFRFPDIIFEPTHLPDTGSDVATYRYYVAEVGTVENVSNGDERPVEFRVNVSADRSGNVRAVTDPANLVSTLRFTNNFYGPESVVLGARKVMTNDVWPLRNPEMTFRFLLTGVNQAAKDKVAAIDASGTLTETATQAVPTARFDDFIFTLSDYEKLTDPDAPAEERYYLFEIAEEIPTIGGVAQNPYQGITYSTVKYHVRVDLDLDPVTGIVSEVVRDAYTGSRIPLSNGIYTFGTFTNSYDTPPAPLTLNARKKVTEANGITGETRNFAFELLYAADGASALEDDVTVSVSDNGQFVNIPISGIVYTKATTPSTGQLSLSRLVNDHHASRVEENGKIHWYIPYILREKVYNGTDMIPNDTSYNLVVIVEDDGFGSLTATVTPEDIELDFENIERKPAEIPVQGKKVLEGRPLTSSDVWTFIITSDTGGKLPVPDRSVVVRDGCPTNAVCVKNSGDTFDVVDFGKIIFTSADLGPAGGARTYRYKVTEAGTVPNVSNSEAEMEFSVTVSVNPATGDLTAVSDPADLNALIAKLTFTNYYYDENTVVFAADKEMNPWSTKVPEFTFTMTGTNDPAIDKINKIKAASHEGGASGVLTAKSTQNTPLARFTQFIFTSDDFNELNAPGYTGDKFYKFEIAEVVPSGVDSNNKLNGVTYSDKKYTVTVELDENTQGEIIPRVSAVDEAGNPVQFGVDPVVYSFRFDNEYDAEDVSWTPLAAKRIVDVDGLDKDRKFSFDLSYVTGDEPKQVELKEDVPVTDLGGAVDVIFSKITFTRDQLAEGETGRVSLPKLVEQGHATRSTNADGQLVWRIPYILTEVPSDDKAMMPNDQEFEIVLHVTDDGEGKLLLTATPDDKAFLTFINVERNNVEIPVEGRKHLTNRNLTLDDKWTYILTAETDGAPMPVPPSAYAVNCPSTAPQGAVCVQNEYRYYDFGTIVFTPQELGDKTAENPNKSKEYKYRVTEIGSIDGVTNDSSAATGKTFTVRVFINPSNSNLDYEITPNNLIDGLTFTNEYNATGVGEILVEKELLGRVNNEWLESDSFEFTLTASANTPMPECGKTEKGCKVTINSSTRDHTMSFGEIPFTQAGTYNYIVRETVPENEEDRIPGVTYDGSDHVVTIILEDDGKGNLVAAPRYSLQKTETITNTYKPAPVTAQVKAKKDLQGRPWRSDDSFIFVITPLNNAPAPTGSRMITIKSTDALYTKAFGTITYTEPGTYEYEVSEVRNNIGGIVYEDLGPKKLTVTVVDKTDGKLGVSCDPEDFTQSFKNIYSVTPAIGEIRVTKNLTGRQWKEGDTFTFTITAADGTPMPSERTVTIAFGEDITKSFGTIKFEKAGEYTYTVQETIPEDSAKIEGITYDENAYTVTIKVTDDGVGHMVADGTPLVQTVAVTNTYGDVGIGRIYAQKNLDGREWKTGDSFSFTLKAEDGTPMPLRCANESACTVTITDADSATGYIKSFGDINFTQTGTYIYTVTENIPADTQKIGGITYDQTEHTVIIRVKVNPETGTVEAEEGSSLEQTAAFTNTYAATGEGEIKVTKNFTGRAWSDADAFLFTITPKGDAPMPGGAQTVMVTNKSANYTESFGKITFTKAGEYSYTVKEFTGGVPGVTYDEQPERTVTFKVKDDGNGNLVADGTEPEQTLTFTNTYAAEGEAELKVMKLLDGAGWPTGGSITFTITAADGTPMPSRCPDEGTCSVEMKEPGTLSFGKVTYDLDDAGKTYTYTITEVMSGFGKGWEPEKESVTLNVTVGADVRTGTLDVSCDADDFTALFVNIFTPEPAEGEIKVRKDLQNRAWLTSDSFEFTLEGMNGAPMPDKTQITIDSKSANYTESFGSITFEKAGIYVYTVTETKGRIPGVTYDENTHNVIITIKEVDGKLTADAGELEQTVLITNIYEASGTGTIRVSKRLEGNSWPTGGKIAFVLNGSNGAPMPDGSDGNTALLTAEGITDFGAITYGLENAGQVYTYTVTEYFSDEFGAGWTPAENPVTVKVTVGADDGSGNLAVSCDPQNFTAAFTNIYTAEGKAELKVKKELAGADWPEGGSINFTLTATDGGKMPKECENKTACTVTLNAAGTGSFGEVTYTLDDAGNTYTYTVTEELSGFSSSWAPAQNPVTIKVTVSADDGSGTLKVTCDPEDFSAHFKNIYTAIPAEGEIKVQKDLQNRAWKDGDSFSFTLAGLNGAPMPDVTQITISSRSADYTESFGKITFTEPGSYVYTVKETKGDLPGVTYDETEHTVVITITEADGRLTGDEAVLNQTVEVTNIYEASGTGTIRVSKELEGNTWPAGGSIVFILSGQNGAPMPDGSDGNSVQLTAAGTESFGAITYDLDDAGNVYTYTVKEFFSDEFGTGWAPEENPVTVTITVGADDGSGNLAVSCDPQDFTAAFTNIYTSEGKAELKVKKELSGAEWPSGGSITFTITGAGGAPMPANSTVTLTAPGTASFGEVTYNLADAGKTYTYSVTETLSGFSSGWAPAQNPVTMTVTVGADDGSGKLNVTCDPEDFTALITNIFTPEPIDGEISVSKNLSGREWKDGDSFTFTLTGLNNAPMPPVTQITIDNRTADHTASFGTIWFSDAGTYIYTVTEVKGNIEGVIYDESVHTVAIIVEKDSNGVLSAGAGTVLDPTVVITNTYVVTPVCVQFGGCKYFPGAPEDLQSTEFTYKLSRDGQIIDTATTRGAGGYQFTPFIYSEPGVYNYSVEEEIGDVYGIEYDKNKYNVTVTVERDDSTGVLTATVTDQQGQPFDSTHGMNFNNPYTASAQAYIEVRKTLRGAEWPAGGVVTFVLEGLDGAPMPANNTLRVTGPGVSSFAPISYGIECVGNTYQYNVTEVAEGFGGGWSMDPVSFPVSVTVTRAEDKTLHAEVTYDLGNTVTNIFNNASIQFHGIKLYGGRRVPSNTFQFILEGSDGTYQIVSNNGAYFAFDTIWYKEAGEYTYTISEKVGRDGRIKYDDTVYTVTVTVVRDENDDLQIESITGDDIEMLVFRNDIEHTPPSPPKFPPRLPETGFSAKHFTNLPEMPKDLNYKPLKMLLEIPSISVSEEIVSVPEINDEYPVTWLGEKIGALDGYAMPGKGNAYLTGHNHLNDMNAGPFAFLSWLEKGDRVFLNKGTEGVQIYSVYANEKIGEFDVDRMEEISAQFENSLTMITCEDEYEGGGGYSSRRIVAARPIGN